VLLKGLAMFFDQAINEFLADQGHKQNSEATTRYYQERLEMFRSATEVREVDDFDAATVQSWMLDLGKRRR
jgi:hypothetical protein